MVAQDSDGLAAHLTVSYAGRRHCHDRPSDELLWISRVGSANKLFGSVARLRGSRHGPCLQGMARTIRASSSCAEVAPMRRAARSIRGGDDTDANGAETRSRRIRMRPRP